MNKEKEYSFANYEVVHQKKAFSFANQKRLDIHQIIKENKNNIPNNIKDDSQE